MAIRTPFSTSKSQPASWTSSFQNGTARRSVQWTIWTLTACALTLPVAFADRTEAESATSQIQLPAQNTPSISASSQASPLNSLAVPLPPAPGTVAAPSVLPSLSVKAATAALSSLTVVVSGKTQNASILAESGMTVGEALAVTGISLSKLDRAVPDAADKFQSGMTIRVTRIEIENETRQEPIAAQVRYQPTTSLAPGETKVTQYPKAGYREITEKVYKKDGVVTLRKPVSSKLGRAPQNRVISLGVSSRFMPSSIKPHKRYAKALTYRGGGPRDRAASSNSKGGAPMLRIAKTLKVMTTAYQGAEAGGGGSRTATGMRVGYGAIAVDPRVIPLGSKLYVEGYGYGFACDTGGAIKGHKIDLAMPTIGQCNAYGRKRGVTVYILSE